MCERHSFCITPEGRVLDGLGLTDSHTSMLSLHGLSSADHDKCNLFEWQPPEGWPDASWLDGLHRDGHAFEPKASHDKAAEAHLRKLYPDRAAWDAGDAIRWDEINLPDADRVHRAYDLALRAAPLAPVEDGEILTAVDEHLRRLGVDVRVTEVVDAAIVRASVRGSIADSIADSAWASARVSVSGSVSGSARASVDTSMVRDDADNPFLPLAELATKGAYLYGVTDEGVAYVWRAA